MRFCQGFTWPLAKDWALSAPQLQLWISARFAFYTQSSPVSCPSSLCAPEFLSELSSALVSIVFPSKVRSTRGLQPKLATGQKPDLNQSRILVFQLLQSHPQMCGVFYPSPKGSQSLKSVRLQVQGSRRPRVPFLGPNAVGSQGTAWRQFPWAELEERTDNHFT